MPGPLERIVAAGQIVRLSFQAANMGDAAGTADILGGAVGTEIPMPLPGAIIGMAVRGNAALSTGSATFRPTKNGTAITTFGLGALSSSAQQAYKTKDRTGHAFKAGDRIGVDWTKSGTISPTTIDYIIDVYVLLGDFEA